MMQKNKSSTLLSNACTISIVTCFFLVNVTICTPTVDEGGYVSKTSSSGKVCKTTGCIEAASSILKKLDTTVKPCENFFQFACGKFIKESVIPKDKSSVSMFTETGEKVKQQLKMSLERKMDKNVPRTFMLLQAYFNTCLDTDQIEKTSTNEVLNILSELGGWPVTIGKSWSVSNFDWRKLIYQLRNLGYTGAMDAFLEFSITTDDESNNKYVLTLDQASTGIKQEYLSKGLKENVVQAYYKYMIDLAEILGASRQQAEQELAESLNFEIELAKISLPREERRNRSQLYNPMTIHQLESEYPDVPWIEYFNQILSPQNKIEYNERVVVRVPSFLKYFSKLINNTPKRVLANYAIWRVVQSSTYFMNKRVKSIKAEFSASITGTEVQEPRWVQCIDYVSSYLHLATGALYVREYFDKNSKNIAEEVVSGLRKSFAGLLDKIDWMDEETKQAAVKKLSSVQQHVAYPDEFLDDEKLDGYFRNLEAQPKSFLKSHLNIELFELEKYLGKLRKPVDKTDWTTHGYAAIVNAFYQPSENSIQIPAGILQDVFFKSTRPNYMNFGAIGWIIGHELTHGFDDQGSQYDNEGKLMNWWNPETQKEYLNRAQCIIQQYSNYTVKGIGLNLNGKNTQGENIADNGGIKEAYFAYEEYERQNGEEPHLPGLPYTPRQLFWISAANIWCGKSRPEAMRNQIITGVHSINEYRIVGPFSNMLQFSKDFECPVGSPMNPSKKCTVW